MTYTVRLTWLFIFLSHFLNAQNAKIDSLTIVLKTTSDKRAKADVLHQMASAVWDYDFEKGLAYSEEAYRIAKDLNYKKGISVALADIGLYHYFKGNHKEAFDFLQQALRAAEEANCSDCQAQMQIRLGNLYRGQSHFDSARSFYTKSWVSLGDKKNPRVLSFYYYNLGVLQNMVGEYDSAMIVLHKSLTLRQHLGDSLLMAESLKNIGLVHKNLANYDSSRFYYSLAGGIADRFDDPELKMFYRIYSGELFFLNGNYSEAANLYSKALDLLRVHNFKLYSSLLFFRIGQVYDAQGDYQRALEHFFRALEIDTELKNVQGMAQAQGVIGWTYLNQTNDSTAFVYANHSLRTMEDIQDREGIAYACNLIGNIYLKRNEADRALHFFHRSLGLRANIHERRAYAFTLMNIAKVYEVQNLYSKALQNCQEAQAIFDEIHNLPGTVFIYNQLGSLYTKTKRFDLAYDYLEKARRFSLALPSPPRLRDCYRNFTKLYLAKGDYTKLVFFYDKLVRLNDSTFNNQNYLEKDQLTALYHVEQKENEIKSLQQQNQIKQTEIQLQQSKVKFRDTLLIYTVVGIFLLIILVYTLGKYYRAKSLANDSLQKLNHEVNAQKGKIEMQAEELADGNRVLIQLNNDLLEKQEEIQAQSEELREANDTIGEINRELESTVTKRTNQLKEAYKELDTFFYRSSHDFRRPLTTFMGLSEVAKITVKDANALELFDKVSETAQNLDKMLVKLQSISDVGAQQFVYKEVLIKEIFDNICHAFENQLRQKNIQPVREINLEESFFSYPAMVKIIIENLVENAIFFAGVVDPFVKLKAEQTHSHLILTVEDNGQGVPEQYFERIFEMYFRGNERSKGNGLGLYIVKKAVEKLEGSISLESQLHKGTIFRVELPITKGD